MSHASSHASLVRLHQPIMRPREVPPVAPSPQSRPRWRLSSRKERRRIGGAYYMAREIAAQLQRGTRLLDVGCGDGYIAHHLSSLLGCPAAGVDVRHSTAAPIEYATFDGVRLPHPDATFDALLSAYVLHHAADCRALLRDMARVLVPGGRLVIYEDIPANFIDRLLCWRHERAWRERSGPCTFYLPAAWAAIFEEAGFTLLLSTRLSRFRDLSHPVARQFFVLERKR